MATPRHLLKLSLLSGIILLSATLVRAGTLYRASFHALFDNVYMPLTEMEASYVFEFPAAPTELGESSAVYSLHSASFTLNGQWFESQGGVIRIDNDLFMPDPDRFRDAYYVVAGLNGTFAETLELHAGGLEFSQISLAPSAFDDLDAPISVEDLAGFGVSDFRAATLTFRNLDLGYWLTAGAPIQDLTIVAVPEPSALPLFALALLGSHILNVSRRPKVVSGRGWFHWGEFPGRCPGL